MRGLFVGRGAEVALEYKGAVSLVRDYVGDLIELAGPGV